MDRNYYGTRKNSRFGPEAFKVHGLRLPPLQVKRVMLVVLEEFLKGGRKVREIQIEVERKTTHKISDSKVYDLIRLAVDLQLLWLSPLRGMELESRFPERFENKGRVEVVDDREAEGDYVPTVGAEVVYDLIRELAAKGRDTVHVGLGIGRTTMLLARALSALVRSDTAMPKLVVHALSTSHSVWNPLETPHAFFGFFSQSACEIEFKGLFAEAVVQCDDYDRVLQSEIVRESFALVPEIDIVVTSMASCDDSQGYLYQYLKKWGDPGSIRRLKAEGWQGDVQLRPYSKTGPIPITSGIKPVTLLELEDLVHIAASEDRHVVLLGGRPMPGCPSKAPALLPLLEEPSLHLWNHMVLDYRTAEELVG